MDWFYLALLTALLWGIGQLFIKISSTTISPLWNILIQAALALILYVPFALLNGATFSISPLLMLYILIGATFYNLFYYAIEKGTLIITGSILAMYPLVTVVLSTAFLHESLTALKIGAIMLIFFGIAAMMYRKTKRKEKVSDKVLLAAIGGSIGIGTADFLAKVVIDQNSYENYTLFLPLAYFLSGFVFWIIDKKGRSIKTSFHTGRLTLAVLGVGMLVAGLLSFNAALSTGEVSSVSMVSSIYIGISAVLAFIFLKERVSLIQLLGLLSMFLGAVLISSGY